MLNIASEIKIYLAASHTDMRKGINGLSNLALGLVAENTYKNTMFAFRGRRSDRVKILWWDGQGFCLYYKCMDKGKFTWPNDSNYSKVTITNAQLGMLLEGIDWRSPNWSNGPQYSG